MRKHFRAIIYLLLGTAACQPPDKPAVDLDTGPGKVEIFGPGWISTPLNERDFALAPDRKAIVFTLGNYTQDQRCLVAVKWEGERWTEPEILPFSGQYQDIEPFFTLDGKRLFFASDRPLDSDAITGRTDYNIWTVEKTASGWGVPRPLDPIINTTADEFYPAVSSNGNLYFTAVRDSGPGKEDIYLSQFSNNAYGEPIALDSAINSETYEFNAYISPDEQHLFFSSYGRTDDLGGGDIYYSTRSDTGNWAPAVNLGPEINSGFLDYCPFVDFSRGILYFSSNRHPTGEPGFSTAAQFIEATRRIENGLSNIYHIRLDTFPLPTVTPEIP